MQNLWGEKEGFVFTSLKHSFNCSEVCDHILGDLGKGK